MNQCTRCTHYVQTFQGAECEKETELREAHGWADLGFPMVGPECPHWEPKEEQGDDEK